jgi:multidrug efflux pump subunit AcrA (membrane-fusion protein)
METAVARGLLIMAALAALGAGRLSAGEVTVAPVEVAELKAVYGRVESRFIVPGRSRISGTLAELTVTEGDVVTAGQVIGLVVDPKLESQLKAAEAQLSAAQSQLANAESELKRYEELLTRGATTTQKVDQVRTTLEVARDGVTQAEAARAGIVQQISEGAVLALTVPIRVGEVVMGGEAVATIAGGGPFLRLAIPERHAMDLAIGAEVALEQGTGRVEKVYPLIEGGKVTVDVAVDGLSDAFIDRRVLVQVPIGSRQVLAVPAEALETRAGLDLVHLKTAEGSVEVMVVPGGVVNTADGPRVEILTGLAAGDVVLVP